nr:unnamed protein product [Haemonchus contortus]
MSIINAMFQTLRKKGRKDGVVGLEFIPVKASVEEVDVKENPRESEQFDSKLKQNVNGDCVREKAVTNGLFDSKRKQNVNGEDARENAVESELFDSRGKQIVNG